MKDSKTSHIFLSMLETSKVNSRIDSKSLLIKLTWANGL